MQTNYFIQLKSGGQFDPTTGNITSVEIDDIAHALSNMCRYAGHSRGMYSVAEHSVLVSRIIAELWPDDLMAQWAGLLHDATEAYVCDLPSPLKILLPDYVRIENELGDKIAQTFGIEWTKEIKDRVKTADMIALSTEARLLFDDVSTWDSIRQYTPMPHLLDASFPMESGKAKWRFMDEFNKVKEQLGIISPA